MKEDVILQVNGLKTYFFDRKGKVPAVDGVDFMIRKGETLGIVGESGCGKSVTSMSILKLLPPEGKVVEGEILFKGRDLTKCTSREMEKVRGKEIAMIFQEPSADFKKRSQGKGDSHAGAGRNPITGKTGG